MSNIPPVYLNTVLPEMNRWSRNDLQDLTFTMSEWAQRIADDGFDGVELWQFHATEVDEEEVEKIRTGPCPVKIFNAYCSTEPEEAEARKKIAELALSLGATGMKYNSGKDVDRHPLYVESLREWRKMFPDDFRLMRECHRGSTMADTELANKTLDELGRDSFGMIIHGMDNDLDTLNERFGAYGDRIQHIHGNLSKNGPMSDEDALERIKLLDSLGFKGTFSIEFTQGMRDGLTQEELYANAVRDLKTLRKALEAFYG
jgi:sugar phosphate isomerase/epimerase